MGNWNSIALLAILTLKLDASKFPDPVCGNTLIPRDSECLDCRCLKASPALPRDGVIVFGANVHLWRVHVWHVDLHSAIDRYWHCKDEQDAVAIGISGDV